jgi:hypothetical protein
MNMKRHTIIYGLVLVAMLTAMTAQADDNIPVTKNDDGTWTFVKPAGVNVELEVVYYTQEELDAMTAQTEDVQTDDAQTDDASLSTILSLTEDTLTNDDDDDDEAVTSTKKSKVSKKTNKKTKRRHARRRHRRRR